jgi:formylmethanofuran dehydrogenase subunit E
MDMATMQRIYDNETPQPDDETCDVCGKCWSDDAGFDLPDGRVVCRGCYDKLKEDAE